MVYPAHDFTKKSAGTLFACPECDLLQRAPSRAVRLGALGCARCGATLAKVAPHSLELSLALTVAAAVAFAIANAFPVMSLTLQGRTTSQTLVGLSTALHAAGMTSVAALVLVTIFIMPMLEIAAMLYVLGPVVLGSVPAFLGPVSRLIEVVKPWATLEVLFLGALVSIGRLEKDAQVTLGAAFWSMAVMMVLFAVIDSVFDQRELWSHAAALRRAPRAAASAFSA